MRSPEKDREVLLFGLKNEREFGENAGLEGLVVLLFLGRVGLFVNLEQVFYEFDDID